MEGGGGGGRGSDDSAVNDTTERLPLPPPPTLECDADCALDCTEGGAAVDARVTVLLIEEIEAVAVVWRGCAVPCFCFEEETDGDGEFDDLFVCCDTTSKFGAIFSLPSSPL